MSSFPDPIDLPEEIHKRRLQRKNSLISAAKWGIFIRGSVILFEVLGVIFFGSHALMMDAVASSVDIASSLFLIFCIKFAERPPDAGHPFGHGRFEPLAGLLLGLSFAVIGLWTLTQQPLDNQLDEINPFLWIIPLCATFLLEACYRFVQRIAKKEQSPALASEAVHYRIDAITSLIAAVALFANLDDLGAIAISLIMIILGFKAAKENLPQVLDAPPPDDYFERVRKAAMRIDGVKETEKLKMQLYGPDAHVDIDIEVDPHLTVEVAHKISQKVRAEIQKEWPAVRDASVHIEPYYANDH